MSVKFSGGLFQQLGVTQWAARKDFQPETKKTSLAASDSKDSAEQAPEQKMAGEAEPVTVDAPAVQEAVTQKPADQIKQKNKQQARQPVVVVGQELHALWQDDERLEWQLWCNIMQAMGWSEDEVLFVDTSLLVSEDQLYASVEEVIDLGVGSLLSMDAEHDINEMLSEGSEVLPVPDFDLMLSDPHAKKSFYQQALKLNRTIS